MKKFLLVSFGTALLLDIIFGLSFFAGFLVNV
jgi:hypothetical protein